MDNDEIYDFISEMIYDSPEDYIDDRVLSSAQEKEIQKLKKELETATDEDRIDYLENEIELMETSDNPFILKIYDHFKEDEFTYLILEYCHKPLKC